VWPCVDVAQSVGCRGLHAHWQAHLDVEPTIAQCRSAERGPTLVAPSGRLVVGWGGAPYLAEVPQSAL
jgi:hypothetical protein